VPSVQEEAAGTKGSKGQGKKQIVSRGGAAREEGVAAAPVDADPVLKTVCRRFAAAQIFQFIFDRSGEYVCTMFASVSVGRFW
jgi:hypothetical protein